MKRIVWFFRHLCLWLSIAAVFMLAKYATPPAQATVFTRTIEWQDSVGVVMASLTPIGNTGHNYNFGRVMAGVSLDMENITFGKTGNGPYVGVVRFPRMDDTFTYIDAASGPMACSTIIACSLDVYIWPEQIGTADTLVLGFSGIEVAKTWGEGDNNGSLASNGECTWDKAYPDAEGPPPEGSEISWGADGCRGTADTMGVKAGDTIRIPDGAATNSKYSFKIDTSLANYWRQNATCNGGAIDTVAIRGTTITTAYVTIYGPQTIASGSLGYRPKLRVTYITKDSVAAAAPTGARRRIMEGLQ